MALGRHWGGIGAALGWLGLAGKLLIINRLLKVFVQFSNDYFL
jgi:hypothetical protein